MIVYLFWRNLSGDWGRPTGHPALSDGGTRFLLAGAFGYAYAVLKGAEKSKREHWVDARIVGALLLLGGNGVVSWAEQLVSSSIAALLITTVPLWMIRLGLLRKEIKKPSGEAIAVTLLGFLCIEALVFHPVQAMAESILQEALSS